MKMELSGWHEDGKKSGLVKWPEHQMRECYWILFAEGAMGNEKNSGVCL